MPAAPQPKGPIVLNSLTTGMKKSIGYFQFEYWYLFTDPTDGPALMEKHLESLFTALHTQPVALKKTLCAENRVWKWLEHDTKSPVQAYATDAMRDQFVARSKGDGLAAPLCYYHARTEGVFYEQKKTMPVEKYTINVPYLHVVGMLDIVCLLQAIVQAKSLGLTPNLTVEEVDAGHWCMLAKTKEVGEIFMKWLGDNF